MTESAGEKAGNLERALELLHTILLDDGRSSIGTISRGLGLPLSSAHRLAALFERRGFLIRSKRGRYVAGLALASAVPEHALHNALIATGRPVIAQLARDTGHTAHLGILHGGMVTYLIKEGPAGEQLFTREGMQLEAYCSGIGKVLLAHLTDADRTLYLGQGEFIALTDRTIIDPRRLSEHLDAVRLNGFALDDREVADDLRCLAVPINMADGNVVAAISISTRPATEFALESFIGSLRDAAEAIGKRF